MSFVRTKAPSATGLSKLAHTLAQRIGRYLERQGLLERDAENSYLSDDGLETGTLARLQGASVSYRVAVGAQRGRKVFTLQTLPATGEIAYAEAGKVVGFSLHAGVAARADHEPSWNGCAATFVARRWWSSAFRLLQTAMYGMN